MKSSLSSRGSFGVVHKGTWKDKDVAVKIMVHRDDTSEEDRTREHNNLDKEANLSYTLDHENVVKVE